MDLFKLVGSIFVDNEAANNSLAKTDEKAQKTATSFKDVAGKAAKVGAAAIGAATALGGAVVKMASDASSSMDVIDKASQRMDISAESYQELAHAASLSGVEMGTLEKAAKKLEGTDLNLDDALNQIYELGTAEERAQKASELFGDSIAYTLTPMLNASGEEFAAMRQEANDLGLVFSGDTVKAGAALNDSLSNLKDSAAALVTGVGASLMPVVQQFADKLLEYMPMILGLVEKLTPTFELLFSKLVPPLLDMAEQILPILFQFIEMLIPPVTEIISAILPVLSELLSTILPVAAQIASAVLPIIVQLLQAISPILSPIISLLTPILQLTLALLQPLLELINLILPPIISLLTEVASFMSEHLSGAVSGLLKVFENLRDKAGGIFEGLRDVIKVPVNAVIGFINGLISGVTGGINIIIRALNSLHIELPQWLQNLTGLTSFGFNIPEVVPWQIPLLAKGGEVEGTAVVGEDGPELLQTTGKKTRVTPLNENNNAFVGLEEKMETLIALLTEGFGVYLDGRTVVGRLAPDIDRQLGRLAAQRERGIG